MDEIAILKKDAMRTKRVRGLLERLGGKKGSGEMMLKITKKLL